MLKSNHAWWLSAAIAISVLGVAGCLCALILTTRATVASIPVEIRVTRIELVDQMNKLRRDTLAEIDVRAKDLQRTATNQVTVIRKDALAESEAYRTMADRQLTGARADLQLTVKQSVPAAVAPLEGIRTDLQPVLANAATIEAHADKAVVDLHPQMLGLVAASKVTAGETAQTMRTIRDAAPQFITTGQITNSQIAGVVTDIHVLTTKFTKPLTLKQKIWEAFKASALLLAHVI